MLDLVFNLDLALNSRMVYNSHCLALQNTNGRIFVSIPAIFRGNKTQFDHKWETGLCLGHSQQCKLWVNDKTTTTVRYAMLWSTSNDRHSFSHHIEPNEQTLQNDSSIHNWQFYFILDTPSFFSFDLSIYHFFSVSCSLLCGLPLKIHTTHSTDPMSWYTQSHIEYNLFDI